MPFSLELPMNTPDWTDVGSGVRESYEAMMLFSHVRWASFSTSRSGRR